MSPNSKEEKEDRKKYMKIAADFMSYAVRDISSDKRLAIKYHGNY